MHSHYGQKFAKDFEDGTESNGTLVVVLGEQLRGMGRKFEALGGLLGGELSRHAEGHARVDLSALLAAHAVNVSSQGKDQVEHTDGTPLSKVGRYCELHYKYQLFS